MFETELASRAVAQLVDEAIDDVGSSPRRWIVVLVVLLIGALGLLWVTRRSAIADVPASAPADRPDATPLAQRS